MKYVICALLLLFSIHAVYGENHGTLPELTHPSVIRVCDEGIYILNGPAIYRYSPKDIKLLKKFASKGEGPGEIKDSLYYTNYIHILGDKVQVDTMDKIIYFSKEGELINEKRKKGGLDVQSLPLGKHFAIKKLDRSDNKTEFITLWVCDENFNNIKEVYRQKSPVQATTMNMIMDSLYFWVVGDKLFVDASDKGFVIDVFDKTGKKLYSIDKPIEKIELTSKHKEDALNAYKQNPIVKQIGFENLKKRISFLYPDYFPAIKGILSSGETLYLKTFKKEGDKEEYIAMDLKGKILKKYMLPAVEESPLMARISGINLELFTFHKNKFYYLKENEDEDWELHSVSLK